MYIYCTCLYIQCNKYHIYYYYVHVPWLNYNLYSISLLILVAELCNVWYDGAFVNLMDKVYMYMYTVTVISSLITCIHVCLVNCLPQPLDVHVHVHCNSDILTNYLYTCMFS